MKLNEILNQDKMRLVLDIVHALKHTQDPDRIADLEVLFNTAGLNIHAPVEDLEYQLLSMDTGEGRDNTKLKRFHDKVLKYLHMR